MSHKCLKCGKTLSSQQSLNYHLSSKTCKTNTSGFRLDDQNKLMTKLSNMCETLVTCKYDGTIISFSNKSSLICDLNYMGTSIYTYLHDESSKLEFALQHVKLLSRGDESINNFFTSDIISNKRKLRTVLFKNDDKMIVFQFINDDGTDRSNPSRSLSSALTTSTTIIPPKLVF